MGHYDAVSARRTVDLFGTGGRGRENASSGEALMSETDTGGRAGRLFVLRHRISATHTALVLVLGLAIIIVTSIIASDLTVAGWEESALVFINDWPDALEPLMWVLQQVGVIGTPIIAAIVVYYFTRKWQYFIAFAAILPLKLILEKGVVKQLVERERPFISVGPHINVRGPAFEGLSFPSGHTTTAFAVAVLVSPLLPRNWRILALAWAVVVAVARLYYGEHNILDVVAGAAMGTMFAVALWYLILNRAQEGNETGMVEA